MKNVLAFGASNSSTSINRTFAIWAANQLKNVEVHSADLNDFASPLYSVDLEKQSGIDANALRFYELIQSTDAVIVSLAEYNGLHTSAFKNLWDWLSRIPMDPKFHIWGGKPMFLLSASPSKRPMNNVLRVSKQLFPHFGANIIADFYLPSFHSTFQGEGITEPVLRNHFQDALKKFQSFLDSLS